MAVSTLLGVAWKKALVDRACQSGRGGALACAKSILGKEVDKERRLGQGKMWGRKCSILV
jgi:hypothetical protein